MKYLDLFKGAFDKRGTLFDNKEITNCFRLFNMGGDGLDGLTIDLYGTYILVQYFHEELFDVHENIIKDIAAAAKKLPLPIDGILLKNRVKTKNIKEIQHMRMSSSLEGSAPPDDFTVIQNGVIAQVDLMSGQSTGIFLDMREVRERLVEYYGEITHMLNLFCYTALFSVHALTHGVVSSINIDISKTVIKRAKRNFELNNIAYDSRDFIAGDALKWVGIFQKRENPLNFVVIDPPTFARNKKKSFSVKRDYGKALTHIDRLFDRGYFLTALNARTVLEEEYFSFHPSQWKRLFYMNESSDFPSPDEPYLKVGLWYKS